MPGRPPTANGLCRLALLAFRCDTACMRTGDEPVAGGRWPHAPTQPHGRAVPPGKPPAGKTCAVPSTLL